MAAPARAAPGLLVVVGLVLSIAGLLASLPHLAQTATATVRATRPTQPVVPSRTPTATAAAGSATARATTPATPTPQATAAPLPGVTPGPLARVPDQARFGVDVASFNTHVPAQLQQLGLGWYTSWITLADPPGRVEYWQMIRMKPRGYSPAPEVFTAVARARPGTTWILGNEPDVIVQDNLTPEQYARAYHDVYTRLKAADPSARVALGSISQPTPLRLAYLERVLTEYQHQYGTPLPADVWTTHNYLLREERGSWGAGIPPGFDDVSQGTLYEIDDSGDVSAFQRQLVALRRWMAEHGYRDRPLVITEFGVPMPADYGFPPERVEGFMRATFDFMLSAQDARTGDPADSNRLVQRWAWFSLADPVYATGNLVDLGTGELTPLGRAFALYVAQLGMKGVVGGLDH